MKRTAFIIGGNYCKKLKGVSCMEAVFNVLTGGMLGRG